MTRPRVAAWHASLAGALLLAACASAPQPRKDASEAAGAGDQPLSPQTSAGPAPKETPELPESARGEKAAGEAQEVKLLDPAVREAFDDGMKAAAALDTPRAIARLKRAATSDKRTYWAHYNLGLLYEREGSLSDAEREYLVALDQRPKADRAAENYSKLMVRQGRPDKAVDELKKRIAAAPDAVGLRIALADALLSAGELEGAASEVKKVLKVDEQNVAAMFVLASVYYRQRKPELAMMVLDNAEQVDKERAEIPNLQGVILLGQKKKAQALERFRRAASLRADFPEAHTNLGAMLLSAQSFAEAAQDLELAVKYAPRLAAAHLDLGNAYRGMGDFEKARAAYQEALKLDPKLAADVNFNFGVLYSDADVPQMDPIQRNEQAIAYFTKVKEAGRGDDAVEQYLKDAKKAIDREQRRREREEKDKLRKQKKAEEEAKRSSEAEAKRKADDEKARADADKKAASDAAAKKPGAAKAQPKAASKLGDDDSAAPPSKPKGTQGKMSDD
jgi:Tfp pilus assembly protein PilF